MSIVLADINSNHMLPDGQPYEFTDYPIWFNLWMKDPDNSNGREFVIFEGSGTTDYFQLTLNNTYADTPASYSGVRLEAEVAQGSRNVPEWHGDLVPLSGWTNITYGIVGPSSHLMYLNNSLQTPDVTNYPMTYFNDEWDTFDEWHFFGRHNGNGPGIGALFAGLVVAGRPFTTTERGLLQSFWPSSLPSLADCRVWDCEDDLLEANGGVALVNNNTDQFTLDGSAGANPPIGVFSQGGRIRMRSNRVIVRGNQVRLN